MTFSQLVKNESPGAHQVSNGNEIASQNAGFPIRFRVKTILLLPTATSELSSMALRQLSRLPTHMLWVVPRLKATPQITTLDFGAKSD